MNVIGATPVTILCQLTLFLECRQTWEKISQPEKVRKDRVRIIGTKYPATLSAICWIGAWKKQIYVGTILQIGSNFPINVIVYAETRHLFFHIWAVV